MFKLVGNGKLVAYKLEQGPTLDLCPYSMFAPVYKVHFHRHCYCLNYSYLEQWEK